MLCVDFETTGLPSEKRSHEAQPGIVQIGIAILDDSFNEIGHINQMINPEKPVWDPGAIKAHGISPEKVKGEPSLLAFLPTLVETFLGQRHWIGFNNPFDRGVLWWQLLRYGWHARFPWPYKDLDMMALSKDYCNIQGKQGVKPPKLIELHQKLFNEGFSGAHDAMNDVRATVRCAKRLHELALFSL